MDGNTENLTDQEIIHKATDKALENGMSLQTINKAFFSQIYWLESGKQTGKNKFQRQLRYGIIFSHDFAKAFWGEEEIDSKDLNADGQCWVCNYDALIYESGFKKWQRHLQQMVLKENPIEYLTNFL